MRASPTTGSDAHFSPSPDNSGKHLGDLRIGRAAVEWRPTRLRKASAVQLKVEKLMELIEENAV